MVLYWISMVTEIVPGLRLSSSRVRPAYRFIAKHVREMKTRSFEEPAL